MPVSGGLQFLNPQEVLAKVGIIAGMKVADLGCGNLGFFIIPAAGLVGKEGIAYAVDILEPVLDAVKNKARMQGLTNLVTVRTNLEKVGSTNIPAGSLDVALLINVLFQNKEHAAMLQEATRLLNKGGKLLIVDWKKVGTPLGPPVSIRVDQEAVKNLASNQQLRLVSEIEFGQYSWGLLFEKM